MAGEARLHLDHGVGFLDAGGHDAAGAVLVERVSGGDPAVRDQGRGEGVAGMTREFLTVHGETPGDGSVDASAGCEACVLGSHLVAPSGAGVLEMLVAEVLVPEISGAALPVVVLSAAVLAVPVSAVRCPAASGRGVPIGYTAWMS